MAQAVSIKSNIVAYNGEYKRRVKHFMQKAAVAVMAEAGSTANHTERVAYAKNVLDGSADIGEYSIGTMSNATVAAAADIGAENQGVTDSDLEFAVNSLLNAFAGVFIPTV